MEQDICNWFASRTPDLARIERIEYDTTLRELFVYFYGEARGYSPNQQEISSLEWHWLCQLEDTLCIYRAFQAKMEKTGRYADFLEWFETPSQKWGGHSPHHLVELGCVGEVFDKLWPY